MAAHLLAPIADLNNFLLNSKVHAYWFPYALLPTLHAARISFIHHALNAKAQNAGAAAAENHEKDPRATSRKSWAYEITGYLIMCWGGGLIANYLVGQTPVQLLTIHPFINYVGVHLVTTFLVRFVLTMPSAKIIDTALILIDGALRTHAVIMCVTMVKASPVASVQNSLLVQILCGTIGATGGGQLAGMLSIHSPNGWSLQTPPALRATSLVEVIDIVAAATCAIVFGLTTLSHPSYMPILAYLHSSDVAAPAKALLSATGARALCTLLFAAAFAYRAIVLHWMPATIAVSSEKAKGESSSVSKSTTGKRNKKTQ